MCSDGDTDDELIKLHHRGRGKDDVVRAKLAPSPVGRLIGERVVGRFLGRKLLKLPCNGSKETNGEMHAALAYPRDHMSRRHRRRCGRFRRALAGARGVAPPAFRLFACARRRYDEGVDVLVLLRHGIDVKRQLIALDAWAVRVEQDGPAPVTEMRTLDCFGLDRLIGLLKDRLDARKRLNGNSNVNITAPCVEEAARLRKQTA